MLATLTDTKGIVALAAALVAVITLLCCAGLLVGQRRLRREQMLALGEKGQQDLVSHPASPHDGSEALRLYVDDVALRLDSRLGAVEGTMRGTIAHRALV